MYDPSLPALLNAAKGAALLLCSERKFHELRAQPGFPAPVAIPGSVSRRWRTSDLIAWVQSLPAATAVSEPTKLKAGKAAKRSASPPVTTTLRARGASSHA